MKHVILFFFCISFCAVLAQSVENVADYPKQQAVFNNKPDAELVIRVGDVDNLGFGFDPGFDPFCGNSTYPHGFPWDVKPEDASGTDRILLPSSYKGSYAPCGGDGYSGSFGEETRPRPVSIPLAAVKGKTVRAAKLQIFIDDFQSPEFCTKFQMTINGKRFPEAERLLNAVSQTGPIGKLVSFDLPDEFLEMLTGESLQVLIDDPTTQAADGYAIDFMRLLINPIAGKGCMGSSQVMVISEENGMPIAGAQLELKGYPNKTTDQLGMASYENVATGLYILFAYAPGYDEGSGMLDIGKDQQGMLVIPLKKSTKTVKFKSKTVRTGDKVVLDNILFDQGSAALRPESYPILDEVVAMLRENPEMQIELSGHTSSEGAREMNQSLSRKRVNSCRDYIASKGIDAGRIQTIGYGPDMPVAPNTTEEGRAKNRRVELRVLRL